MSTDVDSWTESPLSFRFALTAWLLLGFMYLCLGKHEEVHGLKRGERVKVHHNWPLGVFAIVGAWVLLYYVVSGSGEWFMVFTSARAEYAAEAVGLYFYIRGLMYALAGRIALNGYWAQGIYRYPKDADFVRDGIYTRIRHPIYCGQVAIAIGTFLSGNSWVLLGAPVSVFLFDFVRARNETTELKEIHGKAFQDYAKEVPPWAVVLNPLGKSVMQATLTEYDRDEPAA